MLLENSDSIWSSETYSAPVNCGQCKFWHSYDVDDRRCVNRSCRWFGEMTEPFEGCDHGFARGES